MYRVGVEICKRATSQWLVTSHLGLVLFSEVNEILVLLAQTVVAFPLYPIILG